MFKKIAAGFVALVVILLAVVATRPGTMHVERTATIAAAPEVVFAQINDLEAWAAWSPWEKLDPEMEKTFSGPEAGEGAISEWAGNKDVGKGRMTILEAKEPELVKIKLEFFEPFAGVSETAFAIKPEGDGSVVTWTMDGTNNFMAKAMSLVMSFEDMIGKDYEKGLANLKTVAEAAEPPAEAEGEEPLKTADASASGT